MATNQIPTEEEVFQTAETLQQHFLKEHKDNTEFDHRDIVRVQRSLPYVAKFVRHNRGNFDSAYNHMIDCFKWRQSFGVADITFDDIDTNLWKSGMANIHGKDREGNNIVILNIRLHKKNSKKALMMRQWIAFCFETMQQLYPNDKMCMIFDMEGAGLGNMDMDLIRFVINCFKIYFPNLLSWLLVFNMPWILQAAWKIVQSWLSEGAASRVKFVTRENIAEFIDPDNLIKKFGGDDPWTFDYETENAKMLEEWTRLTEMQKQNDGADCEEVSDPQGSASETGSLKEEEGGTSVEVQEEEEGARDGQTETAEKRVRFDSNLPPTRQSRFGTDDDDRPSLSSNPENLKLVGTASTTRQRKQQVQKLLKGSPRDRFQSRKQSLDVTRSLPVDGNPGRRLSEPISLSILAIDPHHELVFTGSADSDILCTLTLTNVSHHTVAYKVKTTAPLRYKVRPNLALIDPRSKAVVQVQLLPGGVGVPISQDKFLVQSYIFDSSTTPPDQNNLSAVWKTLPEKSIKEHRMKCRWSNGQPAAYSASTVDVQQSPLKEPVDSPHHVSRPPPTADKSTTESVSPVNKELQALKTYVNQLVADSARQKEQLYRLQMASYVIIVMLVTLLIAEVLM